MGVEFVHIHFIVSADRLKAFQKDGTVHVVLV